jgi:hypothetical protein
MALTIASVNINPAGGSTAPAQRGNAAALKMSLTTITIGVAGDYSAGGIVLTPQQLGMDSFVLGGFPQIRTVGGAGTAVNGTLDCTNPAAPKLKLNTASAEVAGAGVAGALVDVWAFGA